jgi:hypothetical protein
MLLILPVYTCTALNQRLIKDIKRNIFASYEAMALAIRSFGWE